MKFKKILKTIMASFMILGGACALTSCNVKKSNKGNNTVDGPTYGIDNYTVKLNLGLKVGDLICPYTFNIKRSSAYTNPVDEHYLVNVRQEIREKMGIEITGTKLYHESNDNILFDNKTIVQEMNGYVDCEFLPEYFAVEVENFFSKTVHLIYEVNGDEEKEIYTYNKTDKTGNGSVIDNLFKKTYNLEQNTSLENFENVNATLNSDGTLTGYISDNEQYTTTATFDNTYFEKELYSELNNDLVFKKYTNKFNNEFVLTTVKKQGLNGLFTIKTNQLDGKIYTYEFTTNAHNLLKVTIENVSDNTTKTYKIGAR